MDINRTNIPCSDTNGIPVIREAIFAGMYIKYLLYDIKQKQEPAKNVKMIHSPVIIVI